MFKLFLSQGIDLVRINKAICIQLSVNPNTHKKLCEGKRCRLVFSNPLRSKKKISEGKIIMTYTIRVMPNKVVRLYGKKAIHDPFFLIAESLDSLDFVSLIQRNFGEAS